MQARDKNAEDIGASKPNYKRNNWGLALGGPVVKDKLHFYSAIEYQTENKSFTVNTGQPRFYSALEGVFQPFSPAPAFQDFDSIADFENGDRRDPQ